jgi:ribosomal 30S subunit maturation factor RimM
MGRWVMSLTQTGQVRSFTAKAARDAKEKVQLYRQGHKDAEEEKSFTAKEIIIRSTARPEGREGTTPRVAYRNAPGHAAAEIKSSY